MGEAQIQQAGEAVHDRSECRSSETRGQKSRGRSCLQRVARGGAFALFMAIVVNTVNNILTLPPTYTTYTEFYEMEENTIDVLLLGSSHMGFGFNPADMYEASGVRAFNLASDGQSLWVSYYWLCEALQYQTPKVVVLDCYELFIERGTREAAYDRRAMDYMRMGWNKWQAVLTMYELTGTDTPLSYFLENIRYHARWTELEEEDFRFWEDETRSMGYFLDVMDVCGDESFAPLTQEDIAGVEPEAFESNAAEYLDRITDLCQAKGIELILVKTPTHFETAQRHVAIQEYADEHGLTFYDFNMESLYGEIEFNYATDMRDSFTEGNMNAHANVSGAYKMSTYLAQQLIEVYGVESTVDSQWEEAAVFNAHSHQNMDLLNETYLPDYLERLEQDRYTLFLTLKSSGTGGLTPEIYDLLEQLGFDGCRALEAEGLAYAAVKDNGEVEEFLSYEIYESGLIRGGLVRYDIAIDGSNADGTGSVLIEDERYAQDVAGLYIIVYDNELRSVVDEVCYDTSSEEWTAVRSSDED